MGSYGVIKEALLVKKNGTTDEYSVVQKLVPATVNGMVYNSENGGFEIVDNAVALHSVYRGGVFGFSEGSKSGNVLIVVNIPGYGVNEFLGESLIKNVNGVGQCVMCDPYYPRKPDPSKPTKHYTYLCLVIESPGSVFVKQV